MTHALTLIAAKAALAGSLALGFATMPHAVAHTEPTTSCQYEDGNPDGTPCRWTDPDTGTQYRVNSDNYRADGDPTYCPKDGVWSRTWHWCDDGPDPGPYAYDAVAYIGGCN
jgi:hypothetical protein